MERDSTPDRGFRKVQGGIMVATSLFITGSVGLSAMLRYIFRKDIYGLEELVTIAAFWMYFAGAIYATHSGRHISAEMIGVFVKNPRRLAWIRVVRSAITTGLCGLYAWWGWGFFHWSLVEGGKTTLLQIPLVVAQSAIFVGLLSMAVYFAVDLKDAVRKALAPELR